LEAEGQGRRAAHNISDAERAQLKPTRPLCHDLGETPANVALAWVLHNPVVTAPIIGPRTMAQLEGALRALEIHLADDVLTRLDEIFPGFGGAAPMAYSW
jgi:aryl-alcohol dehydrogenase-like predicted oxidoreductase